MAPRRLPNSMSVRIVKAWYKISVSIIAVGKAKGDFVGVDVLLCRACCQFGLPIFSYCWFHQTREKEVSPRPFPKGWQGHREWTRPTRFLTQTQRRQDFLYFVAKDDPQLYSRPLGAITHQIQDSSVISSWLSNIFSGRKFGIHIPRYGAHGTVFPGGGSTFLLNRCFQRLGRIFLQGIRKGQVQELSHPTLGIR